MRSILLALSLLTVTCYHVFAQQTYERAYPSPFNDATDWSVTYSVLDNTLWYAIVENSDIVLHHLDAAGTVTATYRYTGMMAEQVRIEQSVNGNIYLTGEQSGSGVDYYVLAVNFTGGFLWCKQYSIGALTSYNHTRIRTLPSGNVMIIESVTGHLGYIEVDGNTGAVVNSAQMREDTTVENKTPGFAADVHSDGSFVFTGKKGSSIAMVRTTAQGNIIWSTVLSGNYFHTKGVAACTDGSTLACGMQSNEAFVMKVDANGVMQWYKAFGGIMTFYDVDQIDSTSFGVCGVTGSDIVYSRFDMNGNELGTIRLTEPTYNFEAYELHADASGKIALPFGYSSFQSGITQAGLLLLEPNFNLECGLSVSPLTSNTTSTDPSIMATPIYRVDEPVSMSSIPVTATTELTGNTTDLCVILGIQQPEPVTLFSLQNTPAEQGQTVTFTLGDYRGTLAYTVTDALGREVIRSVITYGGGQQPIDRSDQLAPGMYIITTYIGDAVQSEKFVIR